MVPRRSAVRLSSDMPRLDCPATMTSPSSGFSNMPVMCSNVDLPAPDGPISATISPGMRLRLASRMTSRRPPPASLKLWRMPFSRRTGSLIAQRLHRIEPRGTPGGIERGQDRENQRHRGDPDDLDRIHNRRQFREEIDRGVEEVGARQALQESPDALDVIGEGGAEQATQRGPEDADTGAGEQEDAHDGATRG